jgi:hypothetical protein
LLTLLAAELTIQPLNGSFVFLKENDVALTSSRWLIAINLDMTPYLDVISTIRKDLLLVEKQS